MSLGLHPSLCIADARRRRGLLREIVPGPNGPAESRFGTISAELYRASKQALETRGLTKGEPKIIFCSTDACKDRFGLKNQAAYTVGALSIVVAPRGWKDYCGQHELTHYWQATEFGHRTRATANRG